MRRTSRRDTLLHNYELQPRQSIRLEARSETHDSAYMRMRKQDIISLQKLDVCRPIVALFSTNDVRVPISLRTDERLYVRLPEDCGCDENNKEISEDESEEKSRETGEVDCASAFETATDKSTKGRSTTGKGKNTGDKRHGNSAKKHAAWTPLRVLAHHSYVAGMRVSGIVHRAIVRLQPERA